MNRTLAYLIVMGFLIVYGDALAMGGGGGRGSVISGRRGQTSKGRNSVLSGKKGVTNEGRNTVKGGAGTTGGNNGGNTGHGRQAAAPGAPKKWPLPAAIEIAALDTSAFDQVKESLKLTDKQTTNIDKAFGEITAKRDTALKAQADARGSYNRAVTSDEIQIAAKEVMLAATQCRNVNPPFLFRKTLRRLLNETQKGKCAFLR